jgi:hypothetical protein
MKSLMNSVAILAALYCIYYQLIFFIFNSLNRNANKDYTGTFLKETLPQILIFLICLIFLVNNIKGLIKNLKNLK